MAYLGHLESDTSGSLPIGDGKIGREARVSNDGRQGIAVLMYQPIAAWKRQLVRIISERGFKSYYLLRSACPVAKSA